MSGGDSYHYGDRVNVYGTHNIGKVHYQSSDVSQALQDLRPLIERLRDQLPPESAQLIDGNLPALTATSPTQDRYRALIAVSTIAETVGAVGEPVVTAIKRVLQLLGLQ